MEEKEMTRQEELQHSALDQTFKLMRYRTKVSANDLQKLQAYIKSLTEDELNQYFKIIAHIQEKQKSGKAIYVSINAIKLCYKLYTAGYKVFPLITKLATKGWSTASGTYSFSMPLLIKSDIESEIFSFGPIAELLKKDNVLDVGVAYNGSLEVDYSTVEKKSETVSAKKK